MKQTVEFVLQSRWEKTWRDVSLSGDQYTYYNLKDAKEGKKNLAAYNKNHHGTDASPLRIVKRITLVYEEVLQ